VLLLHHSHEKYFREEEDRSEGDNTARRRWSCRRDTRAAEMEIRTAMPRSAQSSEERSPLHLLDPSASNAAPAIDDGSAGSS